MTIDAVFKTSSTPLASFLVTEGFPVIDIIFNDEARAFFLFANDSPRIQPIIKDFHLLRAVTNAAQLISNYQVLVKQTKGGA